jgi:hypothetical protein
MKKLLFPIASFIVGINCSVAITSHSSSARVADEVDDRPKATARVGVIQYAPARTNNDADQDVVITTPVQNCMNEVVFHQHRENSIIQDVIETDQ